MALRLQAATTAAAAEMTRLEAATARLAAETLRLEAATTAAAAAARRNCSQGFDCSDKKARRMFVSIDLGDFFGDMGLTGDSEAIPPTLGEAEPTLGEAESHTRPTGDSEAEPTLGEAEPTPTLGEAEPTPTLGWADSSSYSA